LTGNDKTMRPVEKLRDVAVTSILEVTSEFLYVETLEALLQKIVKTVSETYGLAKVHIGIRNDDTGLFEIRAVYGYDPETERQIKRVKYTKERMEKDLRPELKIGRNAYYVPAENWEPDEEDMVFVSHPERMDRARSAPDDWLECDYIDFLMHEKDGSMLGYLEIDEPDSQKVPSEEILKAIEVFADLAAIAIQNSQLYEKVDVERKKIELLLDLIGHDVNNYTQGVSGFIELAMARPDIPPPARKSLAKAHDQVMNLNKLVRNVKIYAKIESAGDKDIRPMNLAAVVKEAFDAAQSSSPTKEISMTLDDDGSEKLSDMNDLAKEVFLNIFTNAIKFDSHELVEIETRIQSVSENRREMWQVSVADHGRGIDDRLKALVFDRFTQAPSTSSGTGLGLHIAKTLVEIYRGRIWVEDRVQGDSTKGSLFKVVLPKSGALD
jgi:signal transduction histidine kinase